MVEHHSSSGIESPEPRPESLDDRSSGLTERQQDRFGRASWIA
jgi:hypothetical protein